MERSPNSTITHGLVHLAKSDEASRYLKLTRCDLLNYTLPPCQEMGVTIMNNNIFSVTLIFFYRITFLLVSLHFGGIIIPNDFRHKCKSEVRTKYDQQWISSMMQSDCFPQLRAHRAYLKWTILIHGYETIFSPCNIPFKDYFSYTAEWECGIQNPKPT